MKINKLKIRKLKFLSICLFAFGAAAISLLIRLFLAPGIARAQEISLSISPPLTEITIQPGKIFSQIFTLKNDGAPVVLAPKIIPFVPLDQQGHAELIEDQASIDAFKTWFSFDPNPISLGNTASHDFNVKIAPPEGVEEKDYYFTFLITLQNDNNLGVNNSQAQARIGANILINVSKDGNPAKSASISEFTAPTVIDSFTPLTYKIFIENTGASFFKPTGKIAVNQIFGSTTTLNLAPLNILVGSKREIVCLQGEVLVPCALPGKFLIGVYRANLSFTTDNSGSSIEKQTYTFAFPFSITLGLIIIIAGYSLIRRKLNSRI